MKHLSFFELLPNREKEPVEPVRYFVLAVCVKQVRLLFISCFKRCGNHSFAGRCNIKLRANAGDDAVRRTRMDFNMIENTKNKIRKSSE